eukprot:m.331095 g.331095  ORF g.331095 m.331095 type:complete len:205 (-) comp16642_c0_seq1:45-659(-)
MGICRDSQHKRRSTGGRRIAIHKKRKYELGRPAAMTKMGEKRISTLRTMGGNKKYRALRLDHGNFSWPSESVTRKTRIIDVLYNAGNMEFVRTKTLTKGAVIMVDATPFRQFFVSKYNTILGQKKGKSVSEADQEVLNRKKSKHLQRKLDGRKEAAKIDSKITEQAATGRLMARISSRPGQSGRCDGYILEGKELEFYQRKLKK